ncbi:MAG TPA: Dabb family protein [Pirellulales bacterium]|nr:Dabb family protein [Pirellulales bacterium]
MKPSFVFLTLVASAAVAMAAWRTFAADAPGASQKLLRHVVLFKFKKEATPEEIQKVVTAFAALPKQIDTIVDFEWGTDVSPEKLSEGFTHCFLVTFRSAEDRDAYLPHPAHKKFVELIKPVLEKPFVVDYWAQR